MGGLTASQAFMRGSMDRMWTEMDMLLQLNSRLVETILSLPAVVYHGQENPIMIEDDKEEMVVDASHGDDLLVEIVEETPELRVIDDCEESPEV